jgi:hypothetical protein
VTQVRAHVSRQVVAHGVGVPLGAVQQMLEAVGGAAPACSANCQPFFRSRGLSKPVR